MLGWWRWERRLPRTRTAQSSRHLSSTSCLPGSCSICRDDDEADTSAGPEPHESGAQAIAALARVAIPPRLRSAGQPSEQTDRPAIRGVSASLPKTVSEAPSTFWPVAGAIEERFQDS